MGQRLGQHFLKNKKKIEKIVEALDLKEGDVVIEIGPGHGELTELLAKQLLAFSETKLILIEKDKFLVPKLREKFKDDRIEIIEGDALKKLPEIVNTYKFHPVKSDKVGAKQFNRVKLGQYKLAGNIPYYITGFLFRIIGDMENKPSDVVFLIQKEVAERICVKKGNMNLLAASIQIWAEPKIVVNVPKGDFNPPPKIDSSIIKLTARRPCESRDLADLNKYYQAARAVFKQPKKTILNNLFESIGKDKITKEEIGTKLQKIGIASTERPHNLNIEEITQISKLFFQ